jgi:hypothetical protein
MKLASQTAQKQKITQSVILHILFLHKENQHYHLTHTKLLIYPNLLITNVFTMLKITELTPIWATKSWIQKQEQKSLHYWSDL